MNDEMPVLGMFPFASMKGRVEAEPDRAFVVDVGGGYGKPVTSVMQEASNGFGAECILQDRPDVLDDIGQDRIPGVTKMVHDFFKPQPVKSELPQVLTRQLISTDQG